MILQFTLTVLESKMTIARGALCLPEVQNALDKGRLILKGGTTVSLLAEEIAGTRLGVCGRISPLGAKGPPGTCLDHPHSVAIEGSRVRDIDDTLEEEVLALGADDVFVVGANAIDAQGNAAIMAGSPLGGAPGRILGALPSEGTNVLILAGLEKLIPGSISQAVKACGRKRIDLAFGMAVGLIPLTGTLITEQVAVELLAGVKCTVIGSGGISGAEGATTMVAEGTRAAIRTLFEHVQAVKAASRARAQEGLAECRPGAEGCGEDLACVYRRPVKPGFWD